MKKYYNKLTDLINDDVNYKDDNIISAKDIIDSYLIGYKEELELRNDYQITDILHHYLGENLSGNLNWNEKKQASAIIRNDNNDIILTLVFDCSKPENPTLIDVIDETNSYRTGDIELFKGVLTNYVKSYARNNIETDKKYDRSHNGLYSVNSNFYLYLVDKEAILFFGNVSYIYIILDKDGCIKIDTKTLDAKSKEIVNGREDELLNKVFFNISDAPTFIQEELYIRRKEQVAVLNNNSKYGSLSRIKKILKK